MPDRLSDLRRQRALLAEHLAWLDREIRAAEGQEPPAAPAASAGPGPAVMSPSSTPTPPAAVPPVMPPAPTEEVAEEILSQYRTAPVAVGTSAKRGCLALFAAFMLLAGLVTYGFYLYEKTRLGR